MLSKSKKKQVKKLKILGSGDCGKTTIMKHLKILISGEKPIDSNLFYGSLINFSLISFEYMQENSIKFEKEENLVWKKKNFFFMLIQIQIGKWKIYQKLYRKK